MIPIGKGQIVKVCAGRTIWKDMGGSHIRKQKPSTKREKWNKAVAGEFAEGWFRFVGDSEDCGMEQGR